MTTPIERPLPAGLRAGLAAEYLLDGHVNDTSGNARHGQVIGATPAADRFGREGGAYAFDGKNDYLIVVDPPKLNAEAFTLSLWARLDRREDDADTWHSALACQDSGEAFHHSFTRHGRVFQLAAKGRRIAWHRMSWDGAGDLLTAREYEPGRWHHIAAVVAGDVHRLYLDGELQAEGNSWFNASDEQPLHFGRRAPHMVGNPFGPTYHMAGEPLFLQGALDDVRLYTTALGAAEIGELYHAHGWEG